MKLCTEGILLHAFDTTGEIPMRFDLLRLTVESAIVQLLCNDIVLQIPADGPIRPWTQYDPMFDYAFHCWTRGALSRRRADLVELRNRLNDSSGQQLPNGGHNHLSHRRQCLGRASPPSTLASGTLRNLAKVQITTLCTNV